MAKKYIMVRVEISTYDRLNAIRIGVIQADQRGQLTGRHTGTASDGLTLSDTIERLCLHVLRDRRRVREHKRRKRERAVAECRAR